MRPFVSSLLIGAVMAVKAAAAEEELREELTMRPLPDGKVAAHFSFSTLQRGAVPRAPSSLGTDDTCEHLREFLMAWLTVGGYGVFAFVPLVGAFSQHSITASFP
jgi:hypothetical protein